MLHTFKRYEYCLRKNYSPLLCAKRNFVRLAKGQKSTTGYSFPLSVLRIQLTVSSFPLLSVASQLPLFELCMQAGRVLASLCATVERAKAVKQAAHITQSHSHAPLSPSLPACATLCQTSSFNALCILVSMRHAEVGFSLPSFPFSRSLCQLKQAIICISMVPHSATVPAKNTRTHTHIHRQCKLTSAPIWTSVGIEPQPKPSPYPI